MSTGGFKAFKVTLLGNGLTTVAGRLDQMKLVVGGVSQGLISVGGWVLDTDFTPDINTFQNIGANTSADKLGICQFLKNQSGARLCVAYFNNLASGNPLYSNELWCNNSISSPYKIRSAGLSFAMIPPGIEEAWDITNNCTTAAFIPSGGVPFVSTMSGYSQYNSRSIINTNTNGTNYSFTVICKGNFITFATKQVSANIFPMWASIGDLFGVLCHSEDNGASAKYGTMMWISYGGGQATELGYEAGSAPMYPKRINSSSISSNICYNPGFYRWCTFFQAGAATTYTFTDSMFSKDFYTNPLSFDSYFTTPSSSGRTNFGAIGWAIYSNNPNTYGVIPGDGFKGYFDTDKFRTVWGEFPLGSLFDNGNFIYIGSGIALGWDSTNTVNPFE